MRLMSLLGYEQVPTAHVEAVHRVARLTEHRLCVAVPQAVAVMVYSSMVSCTLLCRHVAECCQLEYAAMLSMQGVPGISLSKP